MPDALVVAGLVLGVAVVVMTVTAVVDVAWGIALALVALGCAVWSPSWRSWLLVVLVASWGLRLSWRVLVRGSSRREDPRHRVLGGVGAWLVSLPLQAAALASPTWTWLVWAGVLVWAVGVLFEAVGDAQLAAYRRDPNRDPVLDRGLWSWTRHPNYFGDACVWWGIWLAGGLASGWLPGVLSLVSPVAMTVWLVWVTGARPLERSMMQRPGYPEYAARTSMFVPRPPRREAR